MEKNNEIFFLCFLFLIIIILFFKNNSSDKKVKIIEKKDEIESLSSNIIKNVKYTSSDSREINIQLQL